MSSPRLAVLGSLRVLNEKQTIHLFASLPAMVVGYLACAGGSGRPVTRSRLAGTLWPEESEAHARTNLANALYRLRRVLGDEIAGQLLCVSDETVALCDVSIDADEFQSLAASSHLSDWRAALDLYHGDLLEDLDVEWALARRVKYQDIYLALLERICNALTQTGEYVEALSVAHRWTLADPLNEESHRSAMRLYACLGRPAAALQQHDHLVRLLDQELGIAPMRESSALSGTIRSEAERLPSTPWQPIIGRRAERAQLLRLAENAQTGRGSLVFVEGEAGIGKTRLLSAFAEGADWRGLMTAWGRGNPFGGPKRYAPLDGAFIQACSGPRIDFLRSRLTSQNLELLATLAPRLRDGVERPLSAPPDWEAALVEGIAALAQFTPLILILDDVQWAGPGFWDALAQLIPRLDNNRLLLVLAYRSTELRANEWAWAALRALDVEFAPLYIELSGLSLSECAELALSLGHPMPGEAIAHLQARSGGSPLFLRELIEQGEHNGTSFAALHERRLKTLTGESRQALEAGAVLGREFAHGPWQELAGELLLEAIPHLLAGRFIEESRQGYTFRHDLIREHVYQEIAAERRRDLHRRAGYILEREHCEPEKLAWHFEQGQTWAEAVHYYQEAGERAMHDYRCEEALEYYTNALELLSRMDEAPQQALEIETKRLALLCQRQAVLGFLERFPLWRADIEEIERLALAANDMASLLIALEARLTCYRWDMDAQTIRDIGRQALRLAGDLGDPHMQARILFILGNGMGEVLGQTGEAIACLQSAVQLAEETANWSLFCKALAELAFQQGLAGQCEAARQSCQRAITLSESHVELYPLSACALHEMSNVHFLLAEWEAARENLYAAIEIATRTQNINGLTASQWQLSRVASCMGQHAEARQAAERWNALCLQTRGYSPDSVLSSDAYVLAGELDLAEHDLGEFIVRAEVNEPVEDGRSSLMQFITLGRLRLAQGRFAEALVPLEYALRIWRDKMRTVELYPPLLHALAAWHSGDAQAARASLQLAEQALGDSEIARFNVLLHFVRYKVSDQIEHLWAAHLEIQRQAALFQEARLRADFLNNIQLHQEIEVCWQARCRAPQRVMLARAGAPLGRALTAAEQISIEWTVDAGETDAEILRCAGSVSLRRYRLLRMIGQARAQGAAPTDDDLAAALGVNVRTVERDIAALRAEGKNIATRKRSLSG